LLDELFLEYEVCDYILWRYAPTAAPFTWRLDPLLVVYDCMDEPSAFKSSPPAGKWREAELLKLADVVFTSGQGPTIISATEATTTSSPRPSVR
jgi:hypothetical protein